MKQSSIVRVRLFGGLGNQLFQYFAGLTAADANKLNLEVDFRWIDKDKFHNKSDVRDFKFINDIKGSVNKSDNRYDFFLDRIKTKLSKKSKLIANYYHLSVPTHPGYVDLTKVKPGFELRGYYQTFRYYEDFVKNFGVPDWNLNFESQQYKELKQQLELRKFIAVHVRGGDYLKKQNIYHRLDTVYYSNSLQNLKNSLGNLPVVVFTDDFNYCKKLLKDFEKIEIIEQKDLRASEVMVLMSLANGIVISNSTFSYWAATVNSGESIIAPSKWYKDKTVDTYMYPLKWKLID